MSNEQFTMLFVIALLSGIILGVKMGLGNRPQPHYGHYPQHDPYNDYVPRGGYGGDFLWVMLLAGFVLFTLFHTNVLAPITQPEPTPVIAPKTVPEAPVPQKVTSTKPARTYIMELQSQRLENYQEATQEARHLKNTYPNIGRIGYFLTDGGDYVLYLGTYNSPDEAYDTRKALGLTPDDAVIIDAAGLELY